VISFAQWLQEQELRGVKNFQMGAKPEAPKHLDTFRRFSPFKAQNPSRPVPLAPIFRKPGNTSCKAKTTVANKLS
jgi:hypothetical protein